MLFHDDVLQLKQQRYTQTNINIKWHVQSTRCELLGIKIDISRGEAIDVTNLL